VGRRHGTNSFESFAHEHALALKRGLVARLGVQAGLDAAAEALDYGWSHWDRVSKMDNPPGYLYRVGLNSARERSPKPIVLPLVEEQAMPWVEPALPDALEKLPEMQRSAILLVHGFGYSLSETADLLGVAKGTVQTHVTRGLTSLRAALGVSQ